MDARFHHFEGEVNRRFEKVDGRFDHFEAEFNLRFDRIDSTLHGIQRSMIVGLGGILAAFGGILTTQQF